jgi:hypothetical protein
MNCETLLCFGDDLAVQKNGGCGYPEYTGHELENKRGRNWNVINLSAKGLRAFDLARHLNANFTSLQALAPEVVILQVGMSDALRGTPAEEFMMCYKQVVLKSLMIASFGNVVLVSIPERPSVSAPALSHPGELVRQYNSGISGLAGQHDLHLLHFRLNHHDFIDHEHLHANGAMCAGRQLAELISKDKRITHASSECLTILKSCHG